MPCRLAVAVNAVTFDRPDLPPPAPKSQHQHPASHHGATPSTPTSHGMTFADPANSPAPQDRKLAPEQTTPVIHTPPNTRFKVLAESDDGTLALPQSVTVTPTTVTITFQTSFTGCVYLLS